MKNGLIIDRYKTKRWYKDNLLHRENGPAIEWFTGDKDWYKNGIRHREDGPALEIINGDKEWWQNGKLHRLDGPAIDQLNKYKFWYYQGKQIDCSSQEEFEKIIKLKIFW